ncbi:MAG: M20 family metallopeptidase [Thermodesulfobacteriota bacterium]
MNGPPLSADPAFNTWLSDLRQTFHMDPELSYQEYRTTGKVTSILKDLGIPFTTFPDLTGTVGLIQGASPGPTTAFRADIDALPLQEENDVPYRSRNSGVMHACGHDAHMTIMLGAAKRMMDGGLTPKLSGNIKLLFQPAEERGAGAKAMIERRVLEDPKVDRIFAGHVSPDLPAGHVGIFKGPGYASADRFEVRIIGKGAHGAKPEEGIDPVVAGSYFVTAVQSVVGRNIKASEGGVITVGKFISGTAANIIPETAFLEGTIRALTENVRSTLIRRMEELLRGLEKSFGVSCKYFFHPGTPVLANDPDTTEILMEASRRVVGAGNIHISTPSMGSEDFSFFAMERPAAILRLGCASSTPEKRFGLHSPRFNIDESVLQIGAEIFFQTMRICNLEGIEGFQGFRLS